MSLIERYFSTTSAGAADGTTWANRAALFSAGNWSSVITGFAFNASDCLRVRAGPGSYTCSQSLGSAIFTNAPTTNNPLLIHGCDSSGVLLSPPNPSWLSCQLPFDDSTLPVIATTTNIATVNQSSTYLRLLKLTGSGANSAVYTSSAGGDWLSIVNSTANSSAIAASSIVWLANSVLSCTGSSYQSVLSSGSGNDCFNCRCVGITGSSGTRNGVATIAGIGGSNYFASVSVVANGGHGFAHTGGSNGVSTRFYRCLSANNGGDGINFPNTASQTSRQWVDHCIITGNGGYGINLTGSNTKMVLTGNRLRDNTSGSFGTFVNYPTDFDNYTTDSDDATEYVDSANGDYRIKNTAPIWGNGYGPGDQSPISQRELRIQSIRNF